MMSKIVIGNQKMYMNKEDVIAFKDMLKETDLTNKEVIVCPTYPFLEYYDGVVPVGAQNVSINDNGAYTGEVSSHQLKSLNIPYCIVGHSERREYNKETDEEINLKVKKLLENNITPPTCLSDTRSLTSSFTVSPSNPTINSCPIFSSKVMLLTFSFISSLSSAIFLPSSVISISFLLSSLTTELPPHPIKIALNTANITNFEIFICIPHSY